MKISFNAGCVVGNRLFYSDNYCNSLFCVDLNTGELKYIGEFPSENHTKTNLHKQCLRYKNKIVFLPDTASNIHIFDVDSCSISTTPIYRSSDTRYLFCGGFLEEDEVYYFPGNLEQRIIKYNMLSKKYEELASFYEVVGKEKDVQSQCFWKMCHKKEKVYLVILGSSRIASYDIKSGSTTVIDTQIEKLDSIYHTEEGFFLCTYDMQLFKWNPDNNITQLINQEGKTKPSGAAIVVGNRHTGLYAVPNYGGELLIYKADKGFIHEESLMIQSSNIDARCVHFENYDYWQSDKIVLFPCIGENIVIISGYKVYDLQLSEITDVIYRNKYLEAMNINNRANYITEGAPYTLNDFLEAVGAN